MLRNTFLCFGRCTFYYFLQSCKYKQHSWRFAWYEPFFFLITCLCFNLSQSTENGGCSPNNFDHVRLWNWNFYIFVSDSALWFAMYCVILYTDQGRTWGGRSICLDCIYMFITGKFILTIGNSLNVWKYKNETITINLYGWVVTRWN